MNKKGAWSDLKNILIALVSFIVLFGAVITIAKVMDTSSSIDTCKTYVNLKSSALTGKILGFETFKTESPCRTQSV